MGGKEEEVDREDLPIIDLEKKSRFGNLLESLRARSESLPRFSRKHTYKIKRRYIDAMPDGEK